MSKNPKVTIALAFVLTFLIGIGAGYLLRGSVQPDAPAVSIASGEVPDELPEERSELQRQGRGEGAGVGSGQRSISPEQADQRHAEPQPRDRENGRYDRDVDETRRDRDPNGDGREWRRDEDRRDRDERNYNRLKMRLKKELDLSDETAETFFSLIEEHREKVREDIVLSHRKIREKHYELQDELEQNLSEILTDEQLETWSERFAPKRDRMHRSDRINKE